jgi:hypothetical protein
LSALEEVEINGFEGYDHEIDFLKLILKSAPMLKKMTLKMSQEASTSNDGCAKIYNIFEAYSSVECNVDHNSAGEYMFGMHTLLACSLMKQRCTPSVRKYLSSKWMKVDVSRVLNTF